MGKDVQDTSIQAYRSILPNIGEKQQLIYDTIRNMISPPTDAEMAKYLDVDTRVVAPRRNELMHLGSIIEVGKRKCTVTHKTAKIWKVI